MIQPLTTCPEIVPWHVHAQRPCEEPADVIQW